MEAHSCCKPPPAAAASVGAGVRADLVLVQLHSAARRAARWLHPTPASPAAAAFLLQSATPRTPAPVQAAKQQSQEAAHLLAPQTVRQRSLMLLVASQGMKRACPCTRNRESPLRLQLCCCTAPGSLVPVHSALRCCHPHAPSPPLQSGSWRSRWIKRKAAPLPPLQVHPLCTLSALLNGRQHLVLPRARRASRGEQGASSCSQPQAGRLLLMREGGRGCHELGCMTW